MSTCYMHASPGFALLSGPNLRRWEHGLPAHDYAHNHVLASKFTISVGSMLKREAPILRTWWKEHVGLQV
jgi:hypothetical protein